MRKEVIKMEFPEEYSRLRDAIISIGGTEQDAYEIALALSNGFKKEAFERLMKIKKGA